MNKAIITILLFLGTISFSTAQETPLKDSLDLTYVVRHNFFENKPLATLRLTETKKGKNVTVATADIKTNKRFEKAYWLNAVFESTYSNDKRHVSHSTWSTVIEKRYWRTVECNWSTPNDASVKRQRKGSDTQEKNIQTIDKTRDVLSAIRCLREFDPGTWNSPVRMNVILDDRDIPVYLKSATEDKLVVDEDTIRCTKMVLRADNKSDITLWIANDEERTPVLAKADLPLGHLDISLEGYTIREIKTDPRETPNNFKPIRKASVPAMLPEKKQATDTMSNKAALDAFFSDLPRKLQEQNNP